MMKMRAGRSQWQWPVAAALLLLIWLVMLVWGTGPWDRAVYEALYAGNRPVLLAMARFFTLLGEPTMLIAATVLCALWLWRLGKARLGATLFLVALFGRGMSEIQKYAVGRARPELEPHLVNVKTSSFPSGHATSSMIFYLAVALALTGRTSAHRSAVCGAIILSLLIGTSRVMLGVHWPSDVIAGWAFGMLWVLVTLKPLEHWLRTDLDRRRLAL